MDASDGYYWYTDTDNPTSTPSPSSPDTGSLSGVGISYAHHSFIPYAGVGLRQQIGSDFHISGFILASPFSWALGIDNHWLRNLKFTDYLEWDLYLFFSVKIGIKLSSCISLMVGWEMTYQPRAEGNTKVEDGTSYAVYADTGGGSFVSQTGSLGLSFRM